MKNTLVLLAAGYFEVYKKQKKEYFGLRDFYSLIKMILAKVILNQEEPTQEDIVHAVQRNFGGYFGDFKPANFFLQTIFENEDKIELMPSKALITEAIKQEDMTRYILLLTKNNAALNIIQEQVNNHIYHILSLMLWVKPVAWRILSGVITSAG